MRHTVFFASFFLGVLSLSSCTWLFFQPMKQHVFSPARINLAFDDVYIPVDKQIILHGWYLPAQGESQGSILFLHGNGENISTHLASVFWLPAAGFDVFLYDYRGYGKSTGKVNLPASIDDVHKVIDYLQEHYPSKKRIVYGQSLGAAIAVNAVSGKRYAKRLAGLVMDSSFSSFRGIAREKLHQSWLLWLFQYPLSLLVTGKYSPINAVKDVAPVPLLVIHGTADKVIPIHHSQRLFKAAKQPKTFWIFKDGKHIHFTTVAENRDRLTAYFKSLPAPGE